MYNTVGTAHNTEFDPTHMFVMLISRFRVIQCLFASNSSIHHYIASPTPPTLSFRPLCNYGRAVKISQIATLMAATFERAHFPPGFTLYQMKVLWKVLWLWWLAAVLLLIIANWESREKMHVSVWAMWLQFVTAFSEPTNFDVLIAYILHFPCTVLSGNKGDSEKL